MWTIQSDLPEETPQNEIMKKKRKMKWFRSVRYYSSVCVDARYFHPNGFLYSITHWCHSMVWFDAVSGATSKSLMIIPYVKLCGRCDSPTYSLNESFFRLFLLLSLWLIAAAAIVVGLANVCNAFSRWYLWWICFCTQHFQCVSILCCMFAPFGCSHDTINRSDDRWIDRLYGYYCYYWCCMRQISTQKRNNNIYHYFDWMTVIVFGHWLRPSFCTAAAINRLAKWPINLIDSFKLTLNDFK